MTQQPHTLPIEDRLRASIGDSWTLDPTYDLRHEAADIIAALYGALEVSEKHVETLHSIMLPAGRKSEGVKIVWRDLTAARAALSLARGEGL